MSGAAAQRILRLYGLQLAINRLRGIRDLSVKATRSDEPVVYSKP